VLQGREAIVEALSTSLSGLDTSHSFGHQGRAMVARGRPCRAAAAAGGLQWAGIAVVVAGYALRRLHGSPARVFVQLLAIGLLCFYNGNDWALLALPVMCLGHAPVGVPRSRWAFYGYYVGHLALFAALAGFAG
jgi:hypothetical protein